MTKSGAYLSGILLMCSFASSAVEHKLSMYDQCLLKRMQTADKTDTVGSVRQYCLEMQKQHIVANHEDKENGVTPLAEREFGALGKRIIGERMREFDPFVIIPHRMNYILPVYWSSNINTDAYHEVDSWPQNLSDLEAKFQLSLKVPLNTEPVFNFGDGLYFAFTVEAWWQLYSDKISKPFRETNYRPEFFYLTPLSFQPFGGNTALIIGAEHQSNGRSQVLSRSWNRIYTGLLWEKGDFAMTFQPWWRVPEKEDEYIGDPQGDDNPDIHEYMGHFELGAAYTWDDFELNVMTRQNFATSKGSVELGLSFPLWGRLRGYGTLFSGYGESLIDYNHSQTRFGLGIALTDLLD